MVLRAIKDLGVSLAIDDFGTGYSSLGYLKRFPISELKIDKSFFEGVPDDVEASTIARGIIALSHTLELSVTAEGIESADQVAFLQTHKCDIIQGYYYSEPLPVDDFERFLKQEASQIVATRRNSSSSK